MSVGVANKFRYVFRLGLSKQLATVEIYCIARYKEDFGNLAAAQTS